MEEARKYKRKLEENGLLPKRRKVDKALRQGMNFIKCLPSEINQNQFFSALIEDVICYAQLLYQKRKNIYSLVEDLFLLSYESRYFSSIHYQHNGNTIVDFFKFLQLPLVFFNVEKVERHHEYHGCSHDHLYDRERMFILLSFCEKIMLRKFFPNLGSKDKIYLPSQNETIVTVEKLMKNRCLCKHISDYGERYFYIKDTLNKWYEEVRPMKSWENEEDFYSTRVKNNLLNPIHNVIHKKNPTVHPRVKDVLHFCL